MANNRLTAKFYERVDAVEVARDLLGKVLYTRINGDVTGAIITETEAYAGVDDRASHAYGGRRTRRTEPMYRQGGIAYVYLCYGIHHLFNVVTSKVGDPKAVLIRGGAPVMGIDAMLERRHKARLDKNLLGGPGSCTQALGIRTEHSGISLSGNRIWIEDHRIDVPDDDVDVGPRIGIDYAGPDAGLPYRFLMTAQRHRRQIM